MHLKGRPHPLSVPGARTMLGNSWAFPKLLLGQISPYWPPPRFFLQLM